MRFTYKVPSRWAAGAVLTIGMLGSSSTPAASAEDQVEVIVEEWRVLAQNSVPAAVSAHQGAEPSAFQQADVRDAQRSLSLKGFNPGPADGVMGPRTRAAIRQFQESESLPITGQLDAQTSGKLGVGAESVGGNFAGAGHEAAEGAKELGREMKQGKPVAAGKELGKGIGRAAKRVGSGVVQAVNPDSDRGSREDQKKEDKKK